MKAILNTVRETIALLLCGLMIFSPQLVMAQSPVASGATSTTVTNAGNGVPVVNIATPSGSGLSHNAFTSYNVDAIGLVVNNGDMSQQFRQSQLAGQLAGNSNLAAGNQANIILMEVTGSNRSVLAGFTEVLGGKADLILANPFGITTNGAGFINTDRVSLITGTPNITGGDLSGFSVNGGDILITGNGLNASAQQMLDLVSRQISVEGQINAQTLNMVAGRNSWDHATNIVTALPDDGSAAPAFSIDSNLLGGMYAGRISLKSTENGVGVRTLGNAAATANDFIINSAGKIEINSQISATRDLSLTSTSAREDAIKGTDASFTAGRDLSLTATSGGATLSGGSIVSTRALTYDLGTLTDAATATAGTTDANKRYGTTVTLNGTGAWDFNGVSYGAGSSLVLTATGLSLGSSAATTLSSGGTLDLSTSSGDLVLADATLQSVGGLTLTSSNGALTFGSAAKVKSTSGALIMSALTGYTNAGIMTSAAGNVSIRANDAIANTGTIYANGLLDIADRDRVWTTGVEYTDWGPVTVNRYIDVTNSVANTGTLQSGTLSLLTSALSVTDGGNVESAGNMNLGVLGQLTIGSGSRIVAATSGIGTATIRGNSDENITPYPNGVGAPEGVSTWVDLSRTKFLGLTNSGTLYSGQHLNLQGNEIENTISGSIGAMNTLAVETGELHNAGKIISETGLLQVHQGSTASLSNTGRMLGRTVDIQAGTLSVTGGGSIESGEDLSIVATNQLDIGGVGDTTSSILAATSGTGTGNISSLGYFYVSSTYVGSERWYGTLNNYGVLFSGNDLVIGGEGVNNLSTGGISALRNLTVTNGRQDYVYNLGTLYAGQDMEIYGYDLGNYGEAYAGGNMLWGITRNLQNYAPVNAGGNVLLSSRIVINTGTIVSGSTLSISASRPEIDSSKNSGILTAPTITLFSQGRFLNTGTIRGGVVTVTGAGIFNDGGTQEIGDPTGVTTTSSPSNSSTPDAVTATATVFPGLNLTLPSNPNGMFIAAINPNSQYLVESNPLFTNLDNFLGSDYLAEKYGFEPDVLIKSLGDAAYETHLVQQQLLSLVSTNLLTGYENEKEQMRGLMDQAGIQAETLGLTYGQALTIEQQAELTGDMIWMVETMVNGQKVLAPVVYLSASTRKIFETGSGVISANTLNMDVGSLTNTGGGVISAEEMNIVTRGNITNVGSTIKGGDVSLTSTAGSIINETKVTRIPGTNVSTVGKQASIESTGTLNLNAGKDIRNLGAKMSAGGDASLTAGRDVTFDTVQEMTSSASGSSGGNIFVKTGTSEASYTITQVKSGLTSGGNLSVKAKNDITLAGTDVEAKGNVDLVADGDINLLARENSSATSKTTTEEGLFVGGGLFGKETVTKGTYVSKNVGTTIKSGKNVSLDALKTVTIQGSDVQAEENIEIFAEDVKVLAGKDVNETTTTTDTITFFKVDILGERSYKAGVEAGAEAEAEISIANRTAKAGAGAKANAAADGSIPSSDDAATGTDPTANSESGAGAGANASIGSTSKTGAGVKLNAEAEAEVEGDIELIGINWAEKTTTTNVDKTTKAVGSTLGAKNITISARKKVTLEGAQIAAKNDLELSGEDVEILAVEDKHVVSSSTSKVKEGLFLSEGMKANVGANYKREYAVGTDGLAVEEGVGVSGSLSKSEQIDILRLKDVSVVTTDTKNVGSNLTSGGDLRINAGNKLTVQGSDITGGKDVVIKAKDMEFLAGKDGHTTEKTSSDTSAGTYVDGTFDANAEAGDNVSLSGTGAKAGINVEAKAEVKAEMGIQGQNTYSKKTESSSKARVSTITSGSGSITRTAENSITDEGTDIEAAGDFIQSSKTFTSKAAADTSTKTNFTMTNSAKLGMYVGAAAGANAEAGGQVGLNVPDAEADAGVKAKVTGGVNASYSGTLKDETKTSSKAVVSSIKSGGKIKSVTTGKTSMEGTLIDGGKGVELEASALDYSAAKDTTSKKSTSGTINAFVEVGAGVDATKAVAVDFNLSGDFKGNKSNEETATAVAGGIISNENISIKTKGDTRLEGTSLTSGGDTNVAAGGNLVFDAARDTASSSAQEINASANLTTTKGKNMLGIGAKAAGSFASESATSSDATAGAITTGGQLNLSAGKAASFEGTIIEAGGDATISGNEGVTMSAAKSTSREQATEIGAGINVSGSKSTKDNETTKERKIGGSVKVELGSASKSVAVGGKVKSDGNLKISSGKDVTMEGTELAAGKQASIKAGGSVNLKAAESSSKSDGFSLNLAGEVTSKTTTKAPGASTDGAKTPDTKTGSDTAKSKNPGTGGTQGSDGSKKSDKDLSTWQGKQAALLQEMKEKKTSGAKAKEGKTEDSAPSTTGTTKDKETDPTKATEKKGNIGLQIQNGNATTKKGVTIKAGGGGVVISAGGGNVNMEGTKIETSGDANISAKKDVNITAAKSTESNFDLSFRLEAEKKTKTPDSATGKSAPKPDAKPKEQTPEKAKKEEKSRTKPELEGKTSEEKAPATPEKKKEPKKDTPQIHIGIHSGNVVTENQQSEIITGGKLNISSGGKTSLTDTKVKATGGENIKAGGGTDRNAL